MPALDQRHSRVAASAPDGPLAAELRYACAATVLATLLGLATERWFGFDEVSLLFLTGVIFVAVRTRLAVAMLSAVLAFLAYNYFFFHPRLSFYIEARQGVATVAIFLVAALVCGRLANQLRTQVVLLRAASSQADALRQLGRRLTAANRDIEAAHAAAASLREVLDAEAVVLLAEPEGWRELTDGASPRFDPVLQLAATRCLERGRDSDTSTTAADDLAWTCLPLALRDRTMGVVALRFATPLPTPASEAAQLAEAIVRDLAEALQRIRLGRQLEAAHVSAETERLRAALLSSVSHDLRSPLSTIVGSAESLCEYQQQISAEDRQSLARDILGEGRRLDRYIQNLLDMTRIGQGPIVLDREWLALDELVGSTVGRLRRDYPDLVLVLELPGSAPLLLGNPALLEQALLNVLDNAAKYSPAHSPITLRASRDDTRLCIEVIDRGPGIPPSARERVFEKFYRVDDRGDGDRNPGGSGLGLSIVRGILDAHGGGVEISSGDDGIGTCVRLCLPRIEVPAAHPGDDG